MHFNCTNLYRLLIAQLSDDGLARGQNIHKCHVLSLEALSPGKCCTFHISPHLSYYTNQAQEVR